MIWSDSKNKAVKLVFSIILALAALNINKHLATINDGKVYLSFISVFMIILNLFLLFDKSDRDKLQKNRIEICAIGCLSILIFLGIFQILLFNIYFYDLLFSFLTSYMTIFLIFTLFMKVRCYRYDEKTIISIISYLAILNFVLGMFQFVTGKNLLIFDWGTNILYGYNYNSVKRVTGFVGASNGAGNFGAMLFAVLLYRYSKYRNLSSFLLILANLVFTILTLTRISYVAIIAEIIVYIIFSKCNSLKAAIKKYWLTILMMLALSAVFIMFFNDIYSLLFQKRGNTATSRLIQFPLAFELFKMHPIAGVGMGQYVYRVYQAYYVKDIAIHSQILNCLVETGVIGCLCYVIFNLCLFLLMIRKIEKKHSWFVIALFAAYLITSNFNPNQYYYINNYIFYFIILGLTYANSFKESETICKSLPRDRNCCMDGIQKNGCGIK